MAPVSNRNAMRRLPGLSDISGLPQADKFMQLVSAHISAKKQSADFADGMETSNSFVATLQEALMAVRADARLTVFGLWLLCFDCILQMCCKLKPPSVSSHDLRCHLIYAWHQAHVL